MPPRCPRTWRELFDRLRKIDGVQLDRGKNHVKVVRNGRTVMALPCTPSERRGLLNACLELRARGIDVRIPA